MQKEAEQNIQPLTSTPNNLSSQEHMFRQNHHGKDLQKCHAMRQNTLSLTYAPPPPSSSIQDHFASKHPETFLPPIVLYHIGQF